MTMREKLLSAALSVSLGSAGAAAYGVPDAQATFSLLCKDFTGCQGEQECVEAYGREACLILCADEQGGYILDCPKDA